MAELDRFLGSLIERLEAGVDLREEPAIELKSSWPDSDESEAQWEIADLVAAIANEPHLDGLMAVVYGPEIDLERPVWLQDEAMLRPKLLRHFDSGVVPRVELLRRNLAGGEVVDILVVVDRSETPYVTRTMFGGEWGVRVRTNTGRRTATRAEILALAGARHSVGHVRRLDVRVDKPNGMRRLTVTNAGTIACNEVRATIPDGAAGSWEGDGAGEILVADRLEPADREAKRFWCGSTPWEATEPRSLSTSKR